MVAHFISTEGTLYAWGNDVAKTGILGLGSNFRQQRPYPNSHLFDYMIKQVDVCASHAAAVDTQGRLFVWGTGNNGELGLDQTQQVFTPTLVTKQKQITVKKAISKKNYTAFCSSAGYLYLFGSLSENGIAPENPLLRSSLRTSRNCGSQKDLLRQSRQNNPLSKSSTRPTSQMTQIMSVSENYITDVVGGKNFLVALSQNGQAFLIDESQQSVEINSNPVSQIAISGTKIIGLNKNSVYVWSSQNLQNKYEKVLLRQNFPMQSLKLTTGYQSCAILSNSGTTKNQACLLFQAPSANFKDSSQNEKVAEYIETEFQNPNQTSTESEPSIEASRLDFKTEVQQEQTEAKLFSERDLVQKTVAKKLEDQFEDKSDMISQETAVIEDSDRIIDSQVAVLIQPIKPTQKMIQHTSNFSFKNPSENQKAVFSVLQQPMHQTSQASEESQNRDFLQNIVLRESQNQFITADERLSTIRDTESAMSVSNIQFIGESTGKKSGKFQLLKEVSPAKNSPCYSDQEDKENLCTSFSILPNQQKQSAQNSKQNAKGMRQSNDMSRAIPEVTVPSFLQFSNSKLPSLIENPIAETDNTCNTIFTQNQRRQSLQQENQQHPPQDRYEQESNDSNFAEEVEISVKFGTQIERNETEKSCFGLIPGLDEVKLSITATPSKVQQSSIQDSNLIVSASSQRSRSYIKGENGKKVSNMEIKSPMSQDGTNLPLQIAVKSVTSSSKQSILSNGFDLSITQSQISPSNTGLMNNLPEIANQKLAEKADDKKGKKGNKQNFVKFLNSQKPKPERDGSPASRASAHQASTEKKSEKEAQQEFPFNTLPVKAAETKVDNAPHSDNQKQEAPTTDFNFQRNQVTPDSQEVIRKINFDESSGKISQQMNMFGQHKTSKPQNTSSSLLNFTITSKQSSAFGKKQLHISDRSGSSNKREGAAPFEFPNRTSNQSEIEMQSSGLKGIEESLLFQNCASPQLAVAPFCANKPSQPFSIKPTETLSDLPLQISPKPEKYEKITSSIEKLILKKGFLAIVQFSQLQEKRNQIEEYCQKNLHIMFQLQKKESDSSFMKNDFSTLSSLKNFSYQALATLIEKALSREVKNLQYQGFKRIKKNYKEKQLELYIKEKQNQFAKQTQILAQIDRVLVAKQQENLQQSFQSIKWHAFEKLKEERELRKAKIEQFTMILLKKQSQLNESSFKKIYQWASEKKYLVFNLKMLFKALNKPRLKILKLSLEDMRQEVERKEKIKVKLGRILGLTMRLELLNLFKSFKGKCQSISQLEQIFAKLNETKERQYKYQALCLINEKVNFKKKTLSLSLLFKTVQMNQKAKLNKAFKQIIAQIEQKKNEDRVKQATVRVLISKISEVMKTKNSKQLAQGFKQIEFHAQNILSQQIAQSNLSFEGKMVTQTMDFRSGFHTHRGRNENTGLYGSNLKESSGTRKSSRKPKLNDYLSFSPRGDPKLFNKFGQRRGTEYVNYSEKTTVAKADSSSTHKTSYQIASSLQKTEQNKKGYDVQREGATPKDFCHASIKDLNNAFKSQISKIKHKEQQVESQSNLQGEGLQSPQQEMEHLIYESMMSNLPAKSPTALNPLCTSENSYIGEARQQKKDFIQKRPQEQVSSKGKKKIERAKWKKGDDENVFGSQEGRFVSKVKEMQTSRVSGETQVQFCKIYDEQVKNSTNTTARKKLERFESKPVGKENILIEQSTQRIKSFNSQQTDHKEKTSPFQPYSNTEHNINDICLFSQRDEQLTKGHIMKEQMNQKKLGEFVAEDLDYELRSRVTNPQRDSIFSNGQQYAEPMEMEMFSPKTETQEVLLGSQDQLGNLFQGADSQGTRQIAVTAQQSSDEDESLALGQGTVIEKMSLELLQKQYLLQHQQFQSSTDIQTTCQVLSDEEANESSESEPYNLQLSSNTKFRVLPGEDGKEPLKSSSANVSDFSAEKHQEPHSEEVVKKLSYGENEKAQNQININVKPYTQTMAYSRAVPQNVRQGQQNSVDNQGESINFNLTQEDQDESSDEDYITDTAEREDEIPAETSNHFIQTYARKVLPQSQIPTIGIQEQTLSGGLTQKDMLKIAAERREKLAQFSQQNRETNQFSSISSQNSHVSPMQSFGGQAQPTSLMNSGASYWSQQHSSNLPRKPQSRNETKVLSSFRNSKISEGSYKSAQNVFAQQPHLPTQNAFQTMKPSMVMPYQQNQAPQTHRQVSGLGIRKNSEPGAALNSHRGPTKGLLALGNVINGQNGNLSHRNQAMSSSRNTQQLKRQGLTASFTSLKGMAQFLNSSSHQQQR